MTRRITINGIIKILEKGNGIGEGAYVSEDKKFVTNGAFMLPNKFPNIKDSGYAKLKPIVIKHLFSERKSATTVYRWHKEVGEYYVYKNCTDIRVINKQYINAMFCALRQDKIDNLKSVIIKAKKSNRMKQCYFMGYPIMPTKLDNIKDISKG